MVMLVEMLLGNAMLMGIICLWICCFWNAYGYAGNGICSIKCMSNERLKILSVPENLRSSAVGKRRPLQLYIPFGNCPTAGEMPHYCRTGKVIVGTAALEPLMGKWQRGYSRFGSSLFFYWLLQRSCLDYFLMGKVLLPKILHTRGLTCLSRNCSPALGTLSNLRDVSTTATQG